MAVTLKSREAMIETSIDDRHCRRHKLTLEVEARDSSPTSSYAMVYDVSNSGLLIETDSGLSVGEKIEVELPRVGFVMAEIVWASGRLVGCKFSQVLSKGAVSAARLEGSHSIQVEANRIGLKTLEDESQGQDPGTSSEKFSLGVTLRIIIGLALISWIALYAITFDLIS